MIELKREIEFYKSQCDVLIQRHSQEMVEKNLVINKLYADINRWQAELQANNTRKAACTPRTRESLEKEVRV